MRRALRAEARSDKAANAAWFFKCGPGEYGEGDRFLGVTVPTFPNFYMLYGPGTNGGEIAMNLRNQAAYARRAVQRMVRQGVSAIEVKRSWAEPYHAWLMSKMDGTAWAVSNNYFTTTTGKVVTLAPRERADDR